ncbi:MAG: DUF1015 family protein, partial [Nitrospinae bacterium]|nr:DUF1015 family protein [Nitrospinota bacterium]
AQRQRLVEEMRTRGGSAPVMGLYTGADTLWLLTYAGLQDGARASCTERSHLGPTLDTTLLHRVILEELLQVALPEDAIGFTQDDAAAVDLVARGAYQVAFLLNPTTVEQVVQHARAGARMPRKSTYFYPKLLTGIVLHKEAGDADHVG